MKYIFLIYFIFVSMKTLLSFVNHMFCFFQQKWIHTSSKQIVPHPHHPQQRVNPPPIFRESTHNKQQFSTNSSSVSWNIHWMCFGLHLPYSVFYFNCSRLKSCETDDANLHFWGLPGLNMIGLFKVVPVVICMLFLEQVGKSNSEPFVEPSWFDSSLWWSCVENNFSLLLFNQTVKITIQ